MTFRNLGSALDRNPYLTHAGTTFVDIRWHTEGPCESDIILVGGRTFPSYPGPIHRARVDGLAAGTTYTYTVRIKEATVFTGTFKTFPEAGDVKFCVIGDSGVGLSSPAQFKIANRIGLYDPDFVLHAGDVVYPNGERENYHPNYFAPYGPIISKHPWYHVLSAHDYATERGRPHFANFDKPGIQPGTYPNNRNFKFSCANIECFMLDVFDPDWVSADGHARVDPAWFVLNVAPSTATWKIMVHDVPIYTPASIHSSDLGLRAVLDPLAAALGIDISFCGYNHLYHRSSAINGVVYITTGGGGQSLYAAGPDEAYTVTNVSSYNFVACEINGAAFTANVYDQGRTMTADAFTDQLTLVDATISEHGLAADDRVIVDTTQGGLTAGTVYFVKLIDEDVIELALTSGGATVDLTSAVRHEVTRRLDTWTM